MSDIIAKIKKANLCGRGGAGFPTATKWEMVKKAKGEKKYVIANGSEGEPGVFKDSFILEKYPEKLVAGVILGMEALEVTTGYLYLRKDLYKKHKKRLEEIIKKIVDVNSDMKIIVFREDGKYLCGEETTLLNSIEKKRNEPRFKPPFPTACGLWKKPTLINNIETFYCVAQIAEGKYKNKRFYSISGKVPHPGVYEFKVGVNIEKVLKESKNYPKNDFFVQAGGGACGAVFTKTECKKQCLKGAGALIVHDYKENPLDILQQWTKFFMASNCGQCIPCREGFYRINQLLKHNEINYDLMKDILTVMADTSFCGLGQFAPEGYLDLLKKVIKV